MKNRLGKPVLDISAMHKEVFKLVKSGRPDEALKIRKQIRELTQTDTFDPTFYQKKKGRCNK